MNTPRTKSPKRWKKAEDLERKLIPEGMFERGVSARQFLQALGRIAAIWPYIEEGMIDIFGELLRGPQGTPIRHVYKSIVNVQIRLQILKNLLEEAPQNSDRGEEFDDLLAECKALNKARNTYLHGVWTTHVKSRKIYLTEREFDEPIGSPQRRVSLDELTSIIERMETLRHKLGDIPYAKSRYGFVAFMSSYNRVLEAAERSPEHHELCGENLPEARQALRKRVPRHRRPSPQSQE
jgi:hypothetical protein